MVTGFTGSIEPTMWVRSILIRSSEPVSELEHALQCGELARREGADEDLVVAALLHDVGRYAVRQRLVRDTLDSKEMVKVSTDSRGHHDAGADLLAPWFPKRVVLCIRMHVDAKRYLCAVDPAYLERLSAVSTRTLRMQGWGYGFGGNY